MRKTKESRKAKTYRAARRNERRKQRIIAAEMRLKRRMEGKTYEVHK